LRPDQELGSNLSKAEYKLFAGEQRVTIRGYDGDAMEPFITRDGRWLLFNNRNEKPQNTNLHYAERVDDLTFEYKGEIKGVNTPSLEGVPTLDRAGNLFFVSNRSYEKTLCTIYRGRFAEGLVSGVEIVPGVSRLQGGIVNFDVEISSDGNTLYFVDGDFKSLSPPKSAVIVIAERRGAEFVRMSRSAEILKNVNTQKLQYAAAISEDGLELFFNRLDRNAKPPIPQIFRTERKHIADPFDVPQKIAAITGFAEGPTLSSDGCSLYYHKMRDGKFSIFRVTRPLPTKD